MIENVLTIVAILVLGAVIIGVVITALLAIWASHD